MTKFFLGFFSFGWLRGFDFLPPLLLRLFLAPLLWVSGSSKLGISFDPFTLMNTDNAVFQATAAGIAKIPFIPDALTNLLTMSIGILEVVGAFLLLIGFAVRWISLPLLALILMTAFLALNGENIIDAIKGLFNTYGYTDMNDSPFTTSLVYFIMLLTLFFMGAGRFFSVDWFLYRRMNKKIIASDAAKSAAQVRKEAKADPFDLDNTTD